MRLPSTPCEAWPEFVFHDRVAEELLPAVRAAFADLDVVAMAEGRALAGAWGVPLAWDGDPTTLPDGYDGALRQCLDDRAAGRPQTALVLMAAAVLTGNQGRGLAGHVIGELTRRAIDRGLRYVVAPLRPTSKPAHPRVPIEEFAAWRRPDGLPADPWIRTHLRLGARILGPARRSMVVRGSVAEWESWTNLRFLRSGSYEIPGGLNLLQVDCDADIGCYVEDNLWVQHR